MTTSRGLEDCDDTCVVCSAVPRATQMVTEEGNLLSLRTVSSRSLCLRTIAQAILSIVASHHKASLLVLGNPLPDDAIVTVAALVEIRHRQPDATR